jgi:hypothetical protein
MSFFDLLGKKVKLSQLIRKKFPHPSGCIIMDGARSKNGAPTAFLAE